MKYFLVSAFMLATVLNAYTIQAAEITDVADAADGDDPIDINIDVGFRSTLKRAKITHEWGQLWNETNDTYDRPDFDELRYERQIYAMDYKIQIGLYHDVELYVNLPWIISDTRKINFTGAVTPATSTLFCPGTCQHQGYPGHSLAVDPSVGPSTERAGIGDMQVGMKWAIFNDERDDTKSVWIVGLDYKIPSGKLALPDQVSDGSTGTVGMGQHVITPFMLFSKRFKIMDPYIGIHGSIPVQGKNAETHGLVAPYSGGFLTGFEVVPWENKDRHQKFAIDLRLTTDFFGEVESRGLANSRGTVNELSDFLTTATDGANSTLGRQLQAQDKFTQFGAHLGFAIRAAKFVRFRFGVSLAHNTEHFITGADPCDDRTGEGACTESDDLQNDYDNPIYDAVGRRIRVEETTMFSYWFMGMLTF
jgi:hypothetical protein